jgi:hypothetical protein
MPAPIILILVGGNNAAFSEALRDTIQSQSEVLVTSRVA